MNSRANGLCCLANGFEDRKAQFGARLSKVAEVTIVLHVVGARELFARVIHDDDFVAVTLVAKEFELATHPCIHQVVRQVTDAGRAELPPSSVHMVAKGDGDTMRLLLGLEERVQRIRTFNVAARHLISYRVFGGCGIVLPDVQHCHIPAHSG